MKKRIGSKLYDTDTAEQICPIDGGHLYRKRTRDREWFAVMNDGTFRPLDVYNPLDMLLMETGRLPDAALEDPDPQEYRVRLDRDTYTAISKAAKDRSTSMTAIVRSLINYL